MECDKQHLKGLNLVLGSAVCVILVQTLQTEISFVMNENRQNSLQFTTLGVYEDEEVADNGHETFLFKHWHL